MALRFSALDPYRVGLLGALHDFHHFRPKTSKLRRISNGNMNEKITANFTENFTSSLATFMFILEELLQDIIYELVHLLTISFLSLGS